MTFDLKLDLPENILKEAKEAGLLQPAEIERLLPRRVTPPPRG